jgi:hypothetical protein
MRAATQMTGLLIPFVLIFVSAGTIHFWQGWLLYRDYRNFTDNCGICFFLLVLRKNTFAASSINGHRRGCAARNLYALLA